MGIGIGSMSSSLSSYDLPKREDFKPLPNPDPVNYKIMNSTAVGDNLVILIKYLDCINYEGKKILVYENCSVEELVKQKYIDPHFSQNEEYKSPVARFEPTARGWRLALKLAEDLKLI